MSNRTSFAAVGDIFMTRRLPEKGYQGLDEIVNFIRQFDVKFANLEITVHDREGYPSGFSGGTWAMADPQVLNDIKYLGFNIFNAANNHSMDYSHNGLLATIKYLKMRDMLFAGIGENLADASAPAYIECPNSRVAFIAVTSTFHESWAAGNQRPDMKGRPGVNPLRYKTYYHLNKKYFDNLCEIADSININAKHDLDKSLLCFGNLEFIEDKKNFKKTYPEENDMKRILNSIEDAKKQSDYVLVNIHSHESLGHKEQCADFLKLFAHKCIDAGASAIIGHGPHILRGIEIYKGGIIFYSLGNFIFENDTVSHLPADFYEKYLLSYNAMVGEGMDRRSKNGTIGLGVNPLAWQSVIASWVIEDGQITEVRLHPIDLSYNLPRYRRGLPHLSSNSSIIEHLKQLSIPFGTSINIENDIGTILC